MEEPPPAVDHMWEEQPLRNRRTGREAQHLHQERNQYLVPVRVAIASLIVFLASCVHGEPRCGGQCYHSRSNTILCHGLSEGGGPFQNMDLAKDYVELNSEQRCQIRLFLVWNQIKNKPSIQEGLYESMETRRRLRYELEETHEDSTYAALDCVIDVLK